MKPGSIIISVFIFSIFFTGIVGAETENSMTPEQLKIELGKVADRMKNSSSFSVDVEIISCESDQTEIIHDRFDGYIKKNNNNVRSFMLGINSIQDASKRIVVDTVNKIIAIAAPDTVDASEFYGHLSMEILEQATAIHKIENDQGVKYEIIFNHSLPLLSCSIQIDRSGFISIFTITYNRMLKGRTGNDVPLNIKMFYRNWNVNPTFSKEDFSFERYVSFKNNHCSLKNSYKEYQLLDQRVIIN